MKQYVLVFAVQQPAAIPQRVILVEKVKPDWQKGRLNLPGGSIEEGESVVEAASRELREETSIYCPPNKIVLLGEMYGAPWTKWVVHVCFAPYHYWHDGQPNEPRTMTAEQVLDMNYAEALANPALIRNLRLIIPLCITQVAGWKIIDNPTEITFVQ